MILQARCNEPGAGAPKQRGRRSRCRGAPPRIHTLKASERLSWSPRHPSPSFRGIGKTAWVPAPGPARELELCAVRLCAVRLCAAQLCAWAPPAWLSFWSSFSPMLLLFSSSCVPGRPSWLPFSWSPSASISSPSSSSRSCCLWRIASAPWETLTRTVLRLGMRLRLSPLPPWGARPQADRRSRSFCGHGPPVAQSINSTV